MNKSSLECLLRSHNENSLSSTSTNTAQEVISSISLCQNVFLHISVGTESNIILGYREHEKRTVTFVKSEETILSEGVLEDVDSTHGILFLVKLHDSLGVLGRVRAGNFNRTRDTTFTKKHND